MVTLPDGYALFQQIWFQRSGMRRSLPCLVACHGSYRANRDSDRLATCGRIVNCDSIPLDLHGRLDGGWEWPANSRRVPQCPTRSGTGSRLGGGMCDVRRRLWSCRAGPLHRSRQAEDKVYSLLPPLSEWIAALDEFDEIQAEPTKTIRPRNTPTLRRNGEGR